MIKVFGHKAPDTDSVVSAIVFAWFLREVRGQEAEAFILSEPNKEAVYLLNRFGVKKPQYLDLVNPDDQIALVDTNNIEEIGLDLSLCKIVEIVDHHKLAGNLTTAEPLNITMRAVACTNTILWQMIKEAGALEKLEADIASLMLGAILSDTLNMSSPTTTDIDREAIQELVEITKVDADDLAKYMFAAKSDLSGMSANDIVLMDTKMFNFGENKTRISSLETTCVQKALDLEVELLEAIRTVKNEQNLDYFFFFIVDIIESKAILLLPDQIHIDIAQKAFGKSVENNKMELPGVVSRKKQMTPQLEKAITA